MDRFVAEAEVLQYAEETICGQATNKLWFDLHHGRITSSKFGQVLRRREFTSPKNLMSEILGCKTVPKSTAMKWAGLEKLFSF